MLCFPLHKFIGCIDFRFIVIKEFIQDALCLAQFLIQRFNLKGNGIFTDSGHALHFQFKVINVHAQGVGHGIQHVFSKHGFDLAYLDSRMNEAW